MTTQTHARQSVTVIAIDELRTHPSNVRKSLGDLTELAASIRVHGIIQPIVVTEHPSGTGWLILAGHRRTAAAKQAGLTRLPCVVRHDVDDETAHLALMLVENTHRRALGPVERAEAIQSLLHRGLNQSEVARLLGVHPSSINTFVQLLELDKKSLEAVRTGDLTAGQARAAVKEARATERVDQGKPQRGRPVVVEPPYFSYRNPLAPIVAASCTHSHRPKVGKVGCGQCWETAIRADEREQTAAEPDGVAS